MKTRPLPFPDASAVAAVKHVRLAPQRDSRIASADDALRGGKMLKKLAREPAGTRERMAQKRGHIP